MRFCVPTIEESGGADFRSGKTFLCFLTTFFNYYVSSFVSSTFLTYFLTTTGLTTIGVITTGGNTTLGTTTFG